jgi:hypothetical protein
LNSLSIPAAHTVVGRVRDASTGRAVSDCSVSLMSLFGANLIDQTRTDSAGRYQFGLPQFGQFAVSVACEHYLGQADTFISGESVRRDFRLEAAPRP